MPNFGLVRHKIISIRKMIMPVCTGKTPSVKYCTPPKCKSKYFKSKFITTT